MIEGSLFAAGGSRTSGTGGLPALTKVVVMPLMSLTCKQCEASLELPKGTRFLTCPACSSQLEVHHSGNTAHTEVLKATKTVSPELELEKLDRAWREEEERHGPIGTLQVLQHVMWLVMIVGLVLAGYGVAVDMEHLGGPGPGPVPYVCIFLGSFLVLGWAVFFLSTGDHRSRIAEYRWVAEGYETRRQQLLQDIEESRKMAKAEGNKTPPAP